MGRVEILPGRAGYFRPVQSTNGNTTTSRKRYNEQWLTFVLWGPVKWSFYDLADSIHNYVLTLPNTLIKIHNNSIYLIFTLPWPIPERTTNTKCRLRDIVPKA